DKYAAQAPEQRGQKHKMPAPIYVRFSRSWIRVHHKPGVHCGPGTLSSAFQMAATRSSAHRPQDETLETPQRQI
ncbi:MAG TPA: hypothetical protein VGA09_12515, partial [Candidatus Binatia bacterium]